MAFHNKRGWVRIKQAERVMKYKRGASVSCYCLCICSEWCRDDNARRKGPYWTIVCLYAKLELPKTVRVPRKARRVFKRGQLEDSERFVLKLVSEEKASATEGRKRLDCLVQMRFGRRSRLHLRGQK
jgi:hypothetical protein